MKIRDVRDSDLREIAILSCEINKMHVDACPDIYKTISVEKSLELLNPKITSCDAIFRMVEKESEVLGYYHAEFRETSETDLLKASRFIYLAELMVASRHRGFGVGKSLLSDLREIAERNHINRIDLDVSSFNSGAREFYQSQGFSLARERMTFLGTPTSPSASILMPTGQS